MIDFGFHINPSSTIDMDKVDRTPYERLALTDPDIRSCISCGSCSATCTGSPFSGMSFRKVILGLERGFDPGKMLSCCMLCGKCTMVCPRGINTRHALLSLCRIYGGNADAAGRKATAGWNAAGKNTANGNAAGKNTASWNGVADGNAAGKKEGAK